MGLDMVTWNLLSPSFTYPVSYFVSSWLSLSQDEQVEAPWGAACEVFVVLCFMHDLCFLA